jgi:O-antigen/teichoic acid export membrane protein
MLRAKGLLFGCAGGLALILLLPSRGLGALRPELLAPLLLYFLLAGWSEFLGVVLRARGRRGAEAATILCFRLTTLALVVWAFERGLGLQGLVWALAVSPLLAIAAAAAQVSSLPADAKPEGTAGSLTVLRLALPLGVNGLLALLSLRVEILALPLFVDDQATGLFAAAIGLVTPLALVPAAISAGAMPALTREALKGDGPVRERTITTVALLAVPGALGLAVLAPDIVVRVFGEDYAAAIPALRLLAPALVALFLNAVLVHTLIARGRARLLPLLTATRVGVAALLALGLIPAFGIGAAAGLALSELLLLLLAARACAREAFAVPVARATLVAAALSLPMAAVLAFGSRRALIAIPFGGLTYAATLLLAWRVAPGFLLKPGGAGSES